MRPYIGITGFLSTEEIQSVSQAFLRPSPRLLMAGVQVSSKTLSGRTNKYPGRYPDAYAIRHIFAPHARTINLIHFSTDYPTLLPEQLDCLLDIAGEHLHGFQLNIAWPDPQHLEPYFERDLRFVLQIGNRALLAVDHDPGKLADRLCAYDGLITDILLDPSGGKGQPFDPETVRPFLLEIAARLPHLGLGVAGGLSAQTIHLAEPLIAQFPDISLDAEGRLRQPEDDSLDVDAACAYATAALKFFSS